METDDHLQGSPVLHLRIRVAPAKSDALVDFLRSAREVYERPGGIRLRLLASRDRPGSYVEIIEYADWEKYVSDQVRTDTDAEMREYLARWRGLLDDEPVVETWEDVSYLLTEGAQR